MLVPLSARSACVVAALPADAMAFAAESYRIAPAGTLACATSTANFDPMSARIERRQADRRSSDEELSPEYLALLDVCGGEIRASDRAVLSSRRRGLQAESGDTKDEHTAVAAEAPPPARDRRSPKG
jgi:hypothetical protein